MQPQKGERADSTAERRVTSEQAAVFAAGETMPGTDHLQRLALDLRDERRAHAETRAALDSVTSVAEVNAGEVEKWDHDKYGYDDSGYQRHEVWDAGHEAGSRTLANILLRELGVVRLHISGDGRK
jgi:hypothetical protein